MALAGGRVEEASLEEAIAWGREQADAVTVLLFGGDTVYSAGTVQPVGDGTRGATTAILTADALISKAVAAALPGKKPDRVSVELEWLDDWSGEGMQRTGS